MRYICAVTIEKAYKTFSNSCINLLNTCSSVLKVLVLSRKAPDIYAERKGKLIVMGTGPSMKASLQQNRSYFEHHELMAVNTFSLSDEFLKLKPEYYVMVDPGLWHGENELVRNTMEAIANHTVWPMQLLMPYDAQGKKNIVDLQQRNSNVKITFINYVVFKGAESIAFSFFRKNKAMPQCQNVLVASLFLAINLGYKNIELFGADHNWHEQLAVDENNVVCMKHVHFYENEQQLKLVPFWKAVHIKETFRMDEIFHAWAKVFAGYHLLKRYAANNEANITNLSIVSYIDAFKREAAL